MNIPSPAGSLEARLERPAQPNGVMAILCHPHPLFGGSMYDGVLDCLASALLADGVTCLRFNFRGVGNSPGSHSGGPGEIDDLLAAVAWAQEAEEPTAIWLGGYSFGAFVAWESLSRGLTPERVLLVAPPVGRMPFTRRLAGCPVDIFAGDADEFIDQASLATWTDARVHLLAGADHFFSGAWNDLKRRIELAIA